MRHLTLLLLLVVWAAALRDCWAGNAANVITTDVLACPGDWLPPLCKQNMHLDTQYLPTLTNLTRGRDFRSGGQLFHKKQRDKKLLLQALQRNQLPLPMNSCFLLKPIQVSQIPYKEEREPRHYLPALDELSAPHCPTSHPPMSVADLYSFCNTSASRPIKIVDYGYGSELHFVMRALNEGLRDGISIYPLGKLNIAESEEYCNANHLCYFEPWFWTGCSNSSGSSSAPISLQATTPAELAPWVVPPAFSSLGVFEFRAMTVAFIHRPNAAMRARVRSVVAKIGFDFREPCIGVHIRRGDSCSDKENNRECFENEKYISAIQTMREKYNIHCVYIATDDASAPVAIQAAFAALDKQPPTPLPFRWKSLRVFEQQNDRSAYTKCPNGMCEGIGGKKIYLENERHLYRGKQGFQLGADMHVDVELLSSCVAFVGAMSSNNFRLAVELAYARHGTHPPFISLDTSWCWFGFGEFHIAGRKSRMYC